MTETDQLHRTWPMTRLPLDAEIRAKNIVEQLSAGCGAALAANAAARPTTVGSPSLSVRLGTVGDPLPLFCRLYSARGVEGASAPKAP